MPIPTLKNRLIAAYLIGSAITTALAIWFVAIRLGDLFMAQLDHSLTDKMRIVRSACVQRDGRVIVELGPDLFRRMHDPEDPEFIQLSLAGGGGVLLRSPSLAGVTLERVGADSAEPSLETILLPGGEKGRAAGQFFYPIQGENAGEPIRLHLIAAHHTDRVHAATRSIVILSFQAAALSMLTLTFLIRLMVRRNLRFLSVLSRQIGETCVESRGRKFSLPDAPREVVPVLNRLNELMTRIDKVLHNERQFTANAAHELRTPLAGIRNRVELALSRPRSNEDYEDALADVLHIEDWLEKLVQSLLILARLEAGTQRIDYEPLPIKDLIRRSWKPYFERAEEADIEVELVCDPVFEPPRPLPIELLEIVCRNLFDNALSYTESGGWIGVTVRESERDLTIEVRNAPITADSKMPIDEVFLPFTRGAQSRTPCERHSGIGLALCRRIVQSLNGKISAIRPNEDTFIARARVPIAYERELGEDEEETAEVSAGPPEES